MTTSRICFLVSVVIIMAEFNVGYWDMDAAEYARTVNLMFRLDKLNEKKCDAGIGNKKGERVHGY